MKTIVVAAGALLTASAAPGLAQGAGSAPTACYIEVSKLMSEPPGGIADLGAALRELEEKLRPQVAEINLLRTRIARLEQRQAPGLANASEPALEDETNDVPIANDRTFEDLQKLQAELNSKHAQLKLDYASHQAAIVGPVQARVSQGAQAYGSEQGCGEVKMARAPDLASLSAAGARDVTGGFVSWYAVKHPGPALSAR